MTHRGPFQPYPCCDCDSAAIRGGKRGLGSRSCGTEIGARLCQNALPSSSPSSGCRGKGPSRDCPASAVLPAASGRQPSPGSVPALLTPARSREKRLGAVRTGERSPQHRPRVMDALSSRPPLAPGTSPQALRARSFKHTQC